MKTMLNNMSKETLIEVAADFQEKILLLEEELFNMNEDYQKLKWQCYCTPNGRPTYISNDGDIVSTETGEIVLMKVANYLQYGALGTEDPQFPMYPRLRLIEGILYEVQDNGEYINQETGEVLTLIEIIEENQK